MVFIALMFLTTTCVAGAAAFFSVYGLAHTFTTTFWSVVVMGASLEAGKLMITSYLYRFRDTLTIGKKVMGMFFVFGLMMVTSLGIYGYLADSYQSGSTDMKQIGATVELKKAEQSNLQKRKLEIDNQIARVPDNDTKGKQRLISQFGPEVNTINKRLIAISAEMQDDAKKQIATDSHVGPIVFIAKIVGLDPDRAMSYFILIIVFLFDPVAIYLTVATNEAMEKYKKREPIVDVQPTEVPSVDCSVQTPDPLIEIIHPEEDEPPSEEMVDYTFGGSRSQVEVLPDGTDTEIADLEHFQQRLQDSLILPTVEVPTPVLQDTFTDHSVDDVDLEDNIAPLQGPDIIEEDPIETIKEIYQDITSKETQTPLDKESAGMIEKFLARQKLVKAIRTGKLNQ